MASNSGDPSASRARVVAVRQISRNWTLSSQPDFQLSTKLDHHLFSASLAELNSIANPQLTHSLTNQLLHVTSLNWTALPAWDPCCIASGQTQQKIPPPTIVVMGGCLVMDWISFLWECIYWAVNQAVHVPSCICCIATVVQITIWTLYFVCENTSGMRDIGRV
jgi:hypothetical protein